MRSAIESIKAFFEIRRDIVFVIGNGLITLLFGAYLWFLQPLILRRLAFVQERQATDVVLAVLLLVLPLLEFAGLLLKRPLMLYFAKRYPRQGKSGWPIFLWVMTPVLHLGAACLVLLAAFELLSGGPVGSAPVGFQGVVLFVFFLVLFKETFLIILMFPYGAIPLPGKTSSPEKLSGLEKALRGRLAEMVTWRRMLYSWLGDLLLLCYSAPFYTIMWTSVIGQTALDSSALLMSYLGVSIYFCMIYLGTRGVYVMYEVALELMPYQRWVSGISLFVIWISALFNIPVV